MTDLPPDLPDAFALLMNARPEKGFDLLLAVAALRPEIPFVAVASQSSRLAADEAVARAGLGNVTIIDRTDRIDDLYARARVVLVPSHRFIETFSRVCIEAQRHGKPVIGSDTGNVPLLLAQSGTALPEDPRAWAERLGELYGDAAAYARACEAALANAARYSKADQSAAFDRLVRGVTAPLLIGVGSGLGNMLHAGPMIRNVARRTGAPVDIVVKQDHAETLFLLDDPRYVNSVHTLHPAILERHYDTVFLTHCFDAAPVPFSCDRLLRSRDWDGFAPGTSPHETVFNLEAAKALLGIEYDADDAHAHYVGDLDYAWADGPVVGLHGGSKPGHWASKRWPGFPALAARLKARGFRVVCFGTPEEAVEGAEDRTGGTVEAMARDMRMCSWFVSNDSGVMNLAHALGIPTLSLFAPTEAATRAPLSARCATVVAPGDCVPCEVRDAATFRSGACGCIARIAVDAVEGAFDAMRARLVARAATLPDADARPAIRAAIPLPQHDRSIAC